MKKLMFILSAVLIFSLTASAKSTAKIKSESKEKKALRPPLCNYSEYQYDCWGNIVGYVSIAYWCDSGVIRWDLSTGYIDEIALISNCG
jgi:hypothetical protein